MLNAVFCPCSKRYRGSELLSRNVTTQRHHWILLLSAKTQNGKNIQPEAL